MNVLLAPNKKPSNLTPEQYKLVRTPAFKEWFGDWENSLENASKVVDENGEPLVVYHGSNVDFNIFEKSKTNPYAEKQGYFFAFDKKYAESYNSKYVKPFFINIRIKGTFDDDDNLVPFNADGNIVQGLQVEVYDKKNIKLADGTNTTFDGSNPDIRFDEGGELEIENLSKESREVIDNNYNHSFGFFDFEWNKEIERENFNEWLNDFRKKQFKKNIDVAIKNIESDIELIQKRKIVDLKLKAFEELIIPTLGNQVLSPKLSQYETMVLMNPSATIESMEKGFQEAKNIIDEDGSLNNSKITPSNLFQDDSINLPNFERFIKSNPEYTGVFNDWKKILDEDIELSSKRTYAFRYPSLEKLEKLRSELLSIKNNKTTDIIFDGGGETQPRDLTKIDNYINIYKGAEFYSYSENYEKQGKADRWFELFVINQKERQLNTIEFNEFIQLSNELSWEEFAKGGKVVVLPADIQKYKKIGVEDKYFIEASKDVGLQGINFDSKSILKRIETQFNDMLDNYKMYLINDDSPSITNYINNEIETHREQGSSLETIQRLESMKENESSRRTIIDDIAKTQNESLEKWVDYLRLSEYTLPFKFLILKAVLNFNYDLKQNKLFERGRDTIRNFTPFDAGSLAELNEKKSDFLLMDYNIIMNENSSKILNSQEVVEQSGNGKWIKFNGGKKTKSEDIQKNGTRLMNLVQNTYWCTKSAGTRQLQGGDFYVYVTESNGEIFPRIAVRMNENEVGEVRGNRSSAQDLDAEMLPIAEDFLNKNIPNNSGKKWLDSIKYNKQCVEMRKRFEEEGMYKDFIYDYIKLIADKDKHRVDYGANGNVVLLEQKFQEIIQVSNEYYQKGDIVTDYRLLSPNSIYFIGNLGRYELSSFVGLGDFKDFKLKFVSGSLEMPDNMMNLGNIEYIGINLTINSNLTDLGKIKFIGNMLSLADKLESLSNLESIGGGLQISKSLKDLGKLKKVGFLEIKGCDEAFSFGSLEEIKGDLTILEKSVDIDFGNLKTIGGNFNASNTIITDLKNLESVGGYFFIAGSKIKKFENLKTIGGNADFSNNFCPSTQNIETILGDIKFLNSRIMEFPKLNKIGGSIEFRGSFFKSFGNIKYIGGNLNLAESKIEDLGDLEYVGGYVSFKGSKIKTLNKLKKIVLFANFEGSEVTDLGDLESVGGNLYLRLSKIKSLGKLNYVGGLIYMMKNNYSGLEENYEEIQRQLTN